MQSPFAQKFELQSSLNVPLKMHSSGAVIEKSDTGITMARLN